VFETAKEDLDPDSKTIKDIFKVEGSLASDKQ
jgi:hypothetical protein